MTVGRHQTPQNTAKPSEDLYAKDLNAKDLRIKYELLANTAQDSLP